VLGADTVLVGLDLGAGAKTIPVFGLFPEGSELTDGYSGTRARVTNGRVVIAGPAELVLLSR
jgi:alpha-amylase